MRKLFFLIFLILVVGIVGFVPGGEVKAWDPNLEISEFTCPNEADEGDTVNVSATCRNPASETFSAGDVYLYIEVAAGSPAAGEICHENATKLDPGETIDCSGSFTMPDVDSYVAVKCYYDDTGNIQRLVEDGKWVTLTGAPIETCTEKGGTCCSGGKVCTSGKITGASDCTECCGDVANCKTVEIACPGVPCPEGKICIRNPLCAETFEDLINAIIDFIFYVAIALVPLMVIIAGFCFASAGGDPKKVETAKKIILYTVIGLSIVLLAKGLYVMIEKVIGVSGG